jgi:hypothetical protein
MTGSPITVLAIMWTAWITFGACLNLNEERERDAINALSERIGKDFVIRIIFAIFSPHS